MAFDPNSTETNSGKESKGYTFGLENDLGLIAAATIGSAVMLGSVFYTLLGWSLIASIALVLLPTAPVLTWIFLLKQGKPKGYDGDWLEQLINGHSWNYNARRQPGQKGNR